MLAHQAVEPAAWVPWTGPEDAGNTQVGQACGGLGQPPTPSIQRSPHPGMQKGRVQTPCPQGTYRAAGRRLQSQS